MDNASSRDPVAEPHRLVALGDGVFAIVMTLLVFQLSVPVLQSEETLAGALLDMWPEFAVYVLSFLVLGVFWLIHHVLFDLVRRYDTTLIWLNIGFLMLAALVPFSTELFAEHGAITASAVVYGLNLMTVFGMGWAIFAYASYRRRLVADDLDEKLIRGGVLMGVAYQGFVAVGLALSFVSPAASFVVYGVMVATIIVTTVIGRAEIVMLWPTRGREAHSSATSSVPPPARS